MTPTEKACERMMDRTRRSFPELLAYFVDTFCVGKEFDSCIDSPCQYASRSGCTHPEHPKRRKPHE